MAGVNSTGVPYNPLTAGGGVFNASPNTLVEGQMGGFQLDSIGNLKVTIGSLTPPSFTLTGSASVGVQNGRFTTGTTGVTKSSTGCVYGWSFVNTTASVRYVQFYNQTTAPTIGTNTPIYVIAIPASGSALFFTDVGVRHSSGIAFGLTTDAPGATAATSGDVIGTVFYV